jgi:hypothetical protein
VSLFYPAMTSPTTEYSYLAKARRFTTNLLGRMYFFRNADDLFVIRGRLSYEDDEYFRAQSREIRDIHEVESLLHWLPFIPH